MKLIRNTSLKQRILVPLFLSCGTFGLLLGYLTHKQAKEQLAEDMNLRSQFAANSVSYAIDTLTSQGALHRFVSSIGAQPEIKSVIVAGGSPLRVIASTRHELRGMLVSELDNPLTRSNLETAAAARSSKHEIHKKRLESIYSEPISMGTLAPGDGLGSDGAILVVLGLQYFNDQLASRFMGELIYGAILLLLVTAIAYWLLSQRVLDPIRSIIRAVEEKGKDKAPSVSHSLAPDEIGNLAKMLEDAFEKEVKSSREARTFARDLQFQKYALDERGIVSEADPQGRITYVNKRFCELSGYSNEELIGQNHRIVNSGYHSKDFFDSIYNCLKTEGLWNGEIRNRAKDGSYYWVDSLIVAFKDGKGKLIRYVSIRTDITARKTAEFELLKANEEIERSLKAENAARRDAEKSALAKSQFLATMSHEIRTPMNGLIGVLHLLEEGMPEEKLKLFSTAQNSAEDLLVLINDILDFSKIEAGKMTFENVAFNALELIEEMSDLHAPSAHEKGLELVCSGAPTVSHTGSGDPHRLRQIVSNLISNAIKFTAHGEVVVRLEFIGSDTDKRSIRIEIRDSGIGIEEASQETLFDAFSQENSSTTRQFGGTGLGLSICKKLVELMGGEIGIESRKGEGSTFWFEIPQESCLDENLSSKANRKSKGKRILIVDSNRSTRIQLSEWFNYWNCEFDETSRLDGALNRIEALYEKEGRIYDYIFIDENRIASHSETWQQAQKEKACLFETNIVILHKGDIGLINPEEDGQAFLKKPIHIDNLQDIIFGKPENALPKRSSRDRVPRKTYENLRALLVDDNPTNRLIASKLLEQNHRVTPEIATNGKEALELISKNEYDIIFMDCMMPEMDGYEASRAIRSGQAGEANLKVPIIALTANAMEGDKESCIESGMNDYLAKPLRPKELSLILDRWVGGKTSEVAETIEPKRASADGVVDLSYIEELFDDNQQISQLINTYKETLSENMLSLEKLIRDGQGLKKMGFFSHTIRGSSAECGAHPLSKAAGKMEEACRQGLLDEAVDSFSDVKELSLSTLESLKALGY